MTLNKEQIEHYKNNGYLIIENLFSSTEIEKLKNDAKSFNNKKSLPNVILEQNGSIRSIFAPHKFMSSFDWLYRQKRLVTPAKQLMGGELYLYQYKLNNKNAFNGDCWEWHQDFPFWHLDDGVASPKMLSVMILFQQTESFQGPLMFIPKSHTNDVAHFEFKEHLQNHKDNPLSALNNDLKYTIKKDLVHQLALDNGIVTAGGSIGTCVFFHPNVFHASNSNISPFERNTAIITYNTIDNLPKKKEKKRPEYICSRDYKIIEEIDK